MRPISGASNIVVVAAPGRKLPLISVVFSVPERPLPVKADVQILDFEKSLRNVRYAHGSGHWDGRVLNYRYRPEADIFPHVEDTAAR